MAITSIEQSRSRNRTTVTVTSDLAGSVWYFWYRDGAYIARTASPVYTFGVEPGEQLRVEVIDTNDPDMDPIKAAPAGYPARRTLYWVRTTATDVDFYRVEQKEGAGDWTSIGRVYHSEARWVYSLLTGVLTDLASYQFRVVPVDRAGNDGTPVTLDAETVVRSPDAPDFTASYDGGTQRITFAEDS